jgi:hypothetical protein
VFHIVTHERMCGRLTIDCATSTSYWTDWFSRQSHLGE